jgi:DNA polymerase-3 subunit delta
MEALRSELDKAVLFCRDADRIRAADLEKLVGKTREEAAWAISDAVSGGDVGRARELLRDLVAAGTHPLVVLALLARQARLLLQARLLWDEAGRPAFRDPGSFRSRVAARIESGLFGKGADDVTTIHPFRTFKCFEAARGQGAPALREALARIRRADVDIKTGAADKAEEAVEQLVLELAIRARRAA